MRKLDLYHLPEVVAFFERFRSVFQRVATVSSRKEFFNYCKIFVASRTKKGDEALLHEVQDAEANVRFFAGTYFALSYSAYLLALCHIWLVANVGLSLGKINKVLVLCGFTVALGVCRLVVALGSRDPEEPAEQKRRKRKRAQQQRNWFFTWFTYLLGLIIAMSLEYPYARDSSLLTSMLVSGGAILLMQRGCWLINRRFRLLRIKEVDIVFEAFYLAQIGDDQPAAQAAAASH